MAVYFIGTRNKTAIKIGYSVDPVSRLKTLQTAHYVPLDFLCIINNGTTYDEFSLHRKFRHLHLNGEWYQYSDEILSYIAGLESAAQPKIEECPAKENKVLAEKIRISYSDKIRDETTDSVRKIFEKRKTQTIKRDVLVRELIFTGIHKKEAESRVELLLNEHIIFENPFRINSYYLSSSPPTI